MRQLKTIKPIAQDGIDVGEKWYPTMKRDILRILSERYNHVSPWYACRLFACLSPRCHLTRNMRLWLYYLEHGSFLPGVLGNVKTCCQMLDDGFYDSHGMPYKIGAFANALYGDSSSIVVDSWMCKALNIAQATLKRKSIRQSVERIILRLSDSIGLSPRESQASLWVGTIRQYGRKANNPDLWGEYLRFKQLGFAYD